jgi:hypothetical protein
MKTWTILHSTKILSSGSPNLRKTLDSLFCQIQARVISAQHKPRIPQSE